MKTKAKFYYHPENEDLFCVFVEESRTTGKGKFYSAYSHIGQHSECHEDYIKESIAATPEQYSELQKELTNLVGYELEVIETDYSLA